MIAAAAGPAPERSPYRRRRPRRGSAPRGGPYSSSPAPLPRGCRAVKVSATGFDAFDSPNFPPLAHAGIDIRVDRLGGGPAALPPTPAPLPPHPASPGG